MTGANIKQDDRDITISPTILPKRLAI